MLRNSSRFLMSPAPVTFNNIFNVGKAEARRKDFEKHQKTLLTTMSTIVHELIHNKNLKETEIKIINIDLFFFHGMSKVIENEKNTLDYKTGDFRMDTKAERELIDHRVASLETLQKKGLSSVCTLSPGYIQVTGSQMDALNKRVFTDNREQLVELRERLASRNDEQPISQTWLDLQRPLTAREELVFRVKLLAFASLWAFPFILFISPMVLLQRNGRMKSGNRLSKPWIGP